MWPLPEIEPDAIRALLLLGPLFLLAAVMLFVRPSAQEFTGTMLGVIWNIPFLFLVNKLAGYLGWWRFTSDDLLLEGLPVDVVIGWAAFWGGFLFLATKTQPLVVPIVVAVAIDIWVMPAMPSVLVLGDSWLLGEAAVIVCCLFPGLILARLTGSQEKVAVRAVLQALGWGALVLFLIPAILLEHQGGSVFAYFDWPVWKMMALPASLLGPIFLGLAGVYEFAVKGHGTPIPFDPPRVLVTTGVYAYLANPLQVSTLLMFLILTVFYESLWLLPAALSLVVFSEGFVRWHQRYDIAVRFGEDWTRYRKHVPNWIPRRRPYGHCPRL
jgi:protein-S-isoprenylcysteine O-methyltransferase Ste14